MLARYSPFSFITDTGVNRIKKCLIEFESKKQFRICIPIDYKSGCFRCLLAGDSASAGAARHLKLMSADALRNRGGGERHRDSLVISPFPCCLGDRMAGIAHGDMTVRIGRCLRQRIDGEPQEQETKQRRPMVHTPLLRMTRYESDAFTVVLVAAKHEYSEFGGVKGGSVAMPVLSRDRPVTESRESGRRVVVL